MLGGRKSVRSQRFQCLTGVHQKQNEKKRKPSDIVQYFSENREVKVAKNIQVLIHVNVNTTP